MNESIPGVMRDALFGLITDVIEFHRRIDLTGPGGCWLWRGRLDVNGDGEFPDAAGRLWRAHHWAYIRLGRGRAPGSFHLDEITHTCGTQACVNPEHLSCRRDEPWQRSRNASGGESA
jgi:hypothetical protein